jgi:hypothetical protein
MRAHRIYLPFWVKVTCLVLVILTQILSVDEQGHVTYRQVRYSQAAYE